jgi:hypothetical protein
MYLSWWTDSCSWVLGAQLSVLCWGQVQGACWNSSSSCWLGPWACPAGLHPAASTSCGSFATPLAVGITYPDRWTRCVVRCVQAGSYHLTTTLGAVNPGHLQHRYVAAAASSLPLVLAM